MKVRSPNEPPRHPRGQLPSHRRDDPFFRSLLWNLLLRWVYRFSFHNWYRLRCMIVRLCGGKLHPTAKLRASARIDRPWNLSVGKLSAIGDQAIINAAVPIRIGHYTTVSQHTKIYTQAYDPLTEVPTIYTAPVTIGDNAWIAADVVVMPGVTVHEGVVVGARAMIDRSLPPWTICTGEPATVRRQRPFLEPPAEGAPRMQGAL